MATDTGSEAWRAACEARFVLKLMDQGKGQAAQYLELVAKKRGQQAADELRRAAADMWRKR